MSEIFALLHLLKRTVVIIVACLLHNWRGL